MVTYCSPVLGSTPAILTPLAWPQDAVTRSGAAASKAWRTASVSVSIGVVVQFTCGAGSRALHSVPDSPRSTVTQRYSPAL